MAGRDLVVDRGPGFVPHGEDRRWDRLEVQVLLGLALPRIVELGPRAAIFEDPRHEYTKSLMSAVPVADPRQRKTEKDLNFKPIPSPIFPVGHEPGPSVYDEVAPGHFVLKS